MHTSKPSLRRKQIFMDISDAVLEGNSEVLLEDPKDAQAGCIREVESGMNCGIQIPTLRISKWKMANLVLTRRFEHL